MADYRIMNLMDKWKEATYHLSLMKKNGLLFIASNSSNQKEKSDPLVNFRYEFNAFVNCCRSVTFVLQKTFKKYEGFQEWYTQKQTLLGSDNFAKSLNFLRNMNQKEGNYYPQIVRISKVNDDFTFRSIYSAVPEDIYKDPGISKHIIATNLQLEQNPNEEEEILEYENPEGASFEEIREEMHNILIREYLKDYKERVDKITHEQIQNMKFLRFEILIKDQDSLTMEDFLEKCLNHIYLLRDICKEAEQKFLSS